MNGNTGSIKQKKITPAAVVAATGVVFGAIGTSPLFVMQAVLSGPGLAIDDLFVYGLLSCIFWTLIILFIVKYIVLALETDNKGEGGIFALFALLRRKSSPAAFFVIAGGSVMLTAGIIAPSITLTSSVEGVKIFKPEFPVAAVVAGILALFFFIQRFKPKFIGDLSGPVMMAWFIVIGFTGVYQIIKMPGIIIALNPLYAIMFIGQYPGSFLLLGSVFLCIAGVESVYQELGGYGKAGLRISGLIVMVILLLSYFGQGAWILSHKSEMLTINPLFALIPQKFLIPGIIISILAALIVSQAMINRSFTLVSEAVSLNFWPNIKILHPTLFKGQVYLPLINWIFWIASTCFVLIFRQSSEMAAAYGLVIAANMITTTILMAHFYRRHEKVFGRWWLSLPLLLIIEAGFLAAIVVGFNNSEWFALLLSLLFFLIMLGWHFGRKIKNRYISFANISDYTALFTELKNDKSVPITATNLVYIIKADQADKVESKVIYSIFQRQPKRAETYWFLHIDRVDEPDRFDYEFNPIIPGVLHRVDFHLGFKVEPKINLYFREVLEDLVSSEEINLSSSFASLKKFDFSGDFKYILIDRVMLRDNKLSALENFLLTLHNITRLLDITDERALNLDLTNTIVEQIPVTLEQPAGQRIIRVH